MQSSAPSVSVTNNIFIEVGKSSLTLNGQAPTTLANWIVIPSASSVTITEQTPARIINHIRGPPAESLALTGLQPLRPRKPFKLFGKTPTVSVDLVALIAEPGAGSLSLVGKTLELIWSIGPTKGLATLSGKTPTITYDWVISPNQCELFVIGLQPVRPRKPFKLTGYKPTVELESVGTRLPSKGTLALNGQAPVVSRFIDVNSGALALTGLASNSGDQIPTSVGNLALSGKAPRLSLARTAVGKGSAAITGHSPATTIFVANAAASLQITGYVPTFQFNTIITKIPGKRSVVLSGKIPAATLDIHVISPPVGTLSLTGSAPTLVSGVSVGKGTLTINGKGVTFSFGFGWLIPVATKAASLSGKVPQIGRLANPNVGALTLTGLQATVGRDWVVSPGGGSTYQEASFTYGSATAAQPYDNFTGVPRRRLSGKVPTVFEGVSIVTLPGEGSLALSGSSPTVISHQAAPGELTLAGYKPTLRFSRVNVGKGTLSVSGKVPRLVVPKTWTTGTTTAGAWTLDSGLADGWTKATEKDKSWS